LTVSKDDETVVDELRPFYMDLQLFAEGDDDLGDDDPGDETEEEDEDIDLSEFDLEDPSPKEKKEDDEPDYKVEAAKAKARADALEEQLARDRREREEETRLRPVPAVDRPAPAPVKRRSINEIVDDNFDQEFINDPKGAVRKVLSEYDKERDAIEASRSVGPGASVVDTLADRFMRDMKDTDPEEYAIAVKAFRKQVDETPVNVKAQIAQNPAAQVQSILQAAWDQAYAKGLRENRAAGKKNAETRRGASPPQMGGGRKGGGASGGGNLGGNSGTRYSPLERDMIARAKAGGLDANDIKEMIKEHREEQRQLRGA
jgi:hypothetical protein